MRLTICKLWITAADPYVLAQFVELVRTLSRLVMLLPGGADLTAG